MAYEPVPAYSAPGIRITASYPATAATTPDHIGIELSGDMACPSAATHIVTLLRQAPPSDTASTITGLLESMGQPPQCGGDHA